MQFATVGAGGANIRASQAAHPNTRGTLQHRNALRHNTMNVRERHVPRHRRCPVPIQLHRFGARPREWPRLEVERGGHWRFVERSDHGVLGLEGRYREVTPPERIVNTFEWDGMPGCPVVYTTTFRTSVMAERRS